MPGDVVENGMPVTMRSAEPSSWFPRIAAADETEAETANRRGSSFAQMASKAPAGIARNHVRPQAGFRS